MEISQDGTNIVKWTDWIPKQDLLELQKKSSSSLFEYITEVAQELGQGQPFYIFDLADILWKVQLWKERLPNTKIFYAVKANPDPILLRLLVILELSFDCSSEGEILLVLKAGASPNNILFTHTVKPAEALMYASKVGADLMTFDSEQELLKIHRIFPDARLLLRIVPEYIQCSMDLSDKFGCSMLEARRLIIRAKKLNMNLVGISFHVGSFCTNPKSHHMTIRNCRLLFDEARVQGYSFKILDIGGGFFGAKGTEDSFHQLTDGIRNALKEFFPEGNNLELIAEPGCYMVSSAFTLVTTVLGKRIFNDSSRTAEKRPGMERYYYINDSIYGSFPVGFLLDNIVLKPLVSESKMKERCVYNSKIYGRTCCCKDVIGQPRPLLDMEIGEWLAWENMGDYRQAVCSTFGGVPLPVTRYVFKQNSGFNLRWIHNFDEVVNFTRENAVFIGNDYEKSHA